MRCQRLSSHLALGGEDVSRNAGDRRRRLDEVVGHGPDHLVEDHDRRLRGDEFSEPEIDPLLLGGVGHRLEAFACNQRSLF